MSDGDYDLAEILRSPLEPEPDDGTGRSWGWAAVLFLAGILVGAWIGVESQDGAPAGSSSSTVAADLAAPEVVVVAEPFPEGYVPILTDVAMRAEAPLAVGDRLLVPVTTVLRRGVDPESVLRPLGGRWELRTSQGVVPSLGTVLDPLRPSVSSVEFPIVDPLPDSVVLTERWDATVVTAAVEMAWTGVPFRSDDPIVLDLGSGVSLEITEVDLGNFLGEATWELAGRGLGVVELEVDLLDEAGDLFGSYVTGPGSLDADAGTGTIDFVWAPGFRLDQDQASTLRLTARVALGTAIPTEIEIPLP